MKGAPALDDRCLHGFVGRLCWNARCRNFSGRSRPKALRPSSPPASGTLITLDEARGLESPKPREPFPPAAVRAAPDQLDEGRNGGTELSAATGAGWALLVVRGTRASPETVIALVAEAFALSADDILRMDRHRQYVLPRHIAMYLVREVCGYSFPACGRVFGDRDHTTVMSAHRKVLRHMLTDTKLVSLVDRFRFLLTIEASAAE